MRRVVGGLTIEAAAVAGDIAVRELGGTRRGRSGVGGERLDSRSSMLELASAQVLVAGLAVHGEGEQRGDLARHVWNVDSSIEEGHDELQRSAFAHSQVGLSRTACESRVMGPALRSNRTEPVLISTSGEWGRDPLRIMVGRIDDTSRLMSEPGWSIGKRFR